MAAQEILKVFILLNERYRLCLQLVAYYNGTIKEIIWSQTEKIHWPTGGPPLDNPPCVFSTDDPSCNDGMITLPHPSKQHT